MNLVEMLKEEHILILDTIEDVDSFYAAFSAFLKERGVVRDNEKVKRLFIKREGLHTTAIGKGAAAPHIYSEEFSEFIFSVVLIKEGLSFKAPDKGKVYVVFAVMSDDRDVAFHLKSLADIAHLVGNTDMIEKIKKANTPAHIISIMKKYDWSVF